MSLRWKIYYICTLKGQNTEEQQIGTYVSVCSAPHPHKHNRDSFIYIQEADSIAVIAPCRCPDFNEAASQAHSRYGGLSDPAYIDNSRGFVTTSQRHNTDALGRQFGSN